MLVSDFSLRVLMAYRLVLRSMNRRESRRNGLEVFQGPSLKIDATDRPVLLGSWCSDATLWRHSAQLRVYIPVFASNRPKATFFSFQRFLIGFFRLLTLSSIPKSLNYILASLRKFYPFLVLYFSELNSCNDVI